MIYNSPIEIGLRLLVVLYFKRKGANLDILSFLDYAIIYSNDYNSNLENLHPNLPLKLGEISSKREIVKKGLNVLQMKGLINKDFTNNGVEYFITESGKKLVELLKTDYAESLKERASWASNNFEGKSSLELYNEIVGA